MTLQPDDMTEEKRLKRQEYLIDKKLESFVKVLGDIKECQESLALEVLEFQTAREMLANKLQVSLRDGIGELTPIVGKTIKGYLEATITNFNNSCQESLKTIQQESEKTISSLKKMREQEREFFLFKGLIRNGIGLFSALVVAGGIFYFFPQTKYVRYEVTNDQAQDMLFGRALRKNKQLLSSEALNIIADGVEAELEILHGAEKVQAILKEASKR